MSEPTINSPQSFPSHKGKQGKYTNFQDCKEKILDLEIVEIVGKYTQLKREGANYKGLCPIHKEKTPSLVVSPAKGRWKCFGCGKGGNLINFVMENEGLSFGEALRKLASEHNIELPRREQTDEERKQDLHLEALFIVNKIADAHFEENLFKPENIKILNYARSRWSEETIKLFGIGYAADSWNDLFNYIKSSGYKIGIAQEAGLIKESKEKQKLYDFFRNRLIFPIRDKMGRIVAFTGRIIPGSSDDQAKYINTPETAIYNKSHILYGLDTALKAIKEKGYAYLVEGNPDVIRLQEIGILNTVGSSGTSLSQEQIELLKPILKTLNLIYDGDKAGQKAIKRSAEMLIDNGLTVGVVKMFETEKGEKQDPDSFFKSEEQFKQYVNQNIPDYIIYRAEQQVPKAQNPDFKAKIVDELSALVCKFKDPALHELYIEQLSKIISPKKVWSDKIKAILKVTDPVEKKEIIPGTVDINDFERYGFYADHDGYHFRTKSGIIRGCNFTMKPLFHIQSVINAKRLYQIKNEYGHTEVIELLQKDLVALQSFKVRIESLGNFLWEASETELNKLKRYLYEQTETCIEINQLGWQKIGFYAWGNGIFNGTFKKVDENGIVKHEAKNYYLPAFSSIYKGEEGLFISERRFIHRDSNSITLFDYSRQLIDVFGDNAMIAICFYFATLFRDYLVQVFNFFPILNLFGPKGAGKTELAVSILHFFGKGGKGPNINNTTKAALADHVAQISNGCVHIDEYKNNIDYEKIEFLKGLWDGTGRTRMNMDKDKKKETTAVDCGVILSGQEMPTADIALFSRLVYLSFFKTEYSDEEKKNFNELKEVEKKGLTHITHEILSHRKYFIEQYNNYYDQIAFEITKKLKNEIIEDRLFKNWIMIIAAYATLENKLILPFTHEKLIETTVSQLKIQQRETRTNNEVTEFWDKVQYMYSERTIFEHGDFKVKMEPSLKTDIVDITFPEPIKVLYIVFDRIFIQYLKVGLSGNQKVLKLDTLRYYLEKDKRYLGKKYMSFRFIDPGTKKQIEESVVTRKNIEGDPIDYKTKKKTKTSYAWVFKYDDLNINFETQDELQEDTEIVPPF
jgi:DNA primase